MANGSIIKMACDLFWVYHTKVSDMSQKYELTLANLSDAAVTNLKGMGIPVRFREDKPEQGNFVVCKSTMPLEIYDQFGAKITEVIGNGSKGIATVSPWTWTFKNKEGISASLKKLVVTELKSLAGEDNDSEVL